MMNMFTILGRIKEIKKGEKESTIITIITPQSFKNVDGLYDDNYIDIRLFGNIAENTNNYCNKGDLIAIKGRIQRLDNEKPMELIAEKVSFLKSNGKEEEGE